VYLADQLPYSSFCCRSAYPDVLTAAAVLQQLAFLYGLPTHICIVNALFLQAKYVNDCDQEISLFVLEIGLFF
jgi:hypothetical protein